MREEFRDAAAGFAAGALNAVGGGGSFVTLPTLLAVGFNALQANAIGTVALLPGGYLAAWKYRASLRSFQGASTIALGGASIIGGLLGAMALWMTPIKAFDYAVPWLFLLATVIVAAGPKLIRRPSEGPEAGPPSMMVIQFLLGVYTGFFGGGVGIVMVAVWSMCTWRSPSELNAMRMIMVPLANTSAAILFLVAGLAVTKVTLIIAFAGMIGSLAGASLFLRLPQGVVRPLIIIIGLTVSVGLFLRLRVI